MSAPSPAALAALIPRLAGRRVVVLGDPVLDTYLYGTTHRISREAPVLIVREDGREHRLGGAANTAANVAALLGEVALVAPVGDDDEATLLVDLAKARGIDTAGVVRTSSGCTVTKTRILAGGHNTTKQQMLRLDRESDVPTTAEDEAKLRAAARSTLGALDVLVISDYGTGTLTPLYAELAREARDLGKAVVVDSRRTLAAYVGVTAATPNEPEAEAAIGRPIRTAEDAERAAERLRRDLALEATILTRGKEGMAIAERARQTVLLPAHGDHEAVDVTGAGDTVVATFALALAAGASILEAAALANVAASVVVKSVGAATCSPAELAAALGEALAP